MRKLDIYEAAMKLDRAAFLDGIHHTSETALERYDARKTLWRLIQFDPLNYRGDDELVPSSNGSEN